MTAYQVLSSRRTMSAWLWRRAAPRRPATRKITVEARTYQRVSERATARASGSDRRVVHLGALRAHARHLERADHLVVVDPAELEADHLVPARLLERVDDVAGAVGHRLDLEEQHVVVVVDGEAVVHVLGRHLEAHGHARRDRVGRHDPGELLALHLHLLLARGGRVVAVGDEGEGRQQQHAEGDHREDEPALLPVRQARRCPWCPSRGDSNEWVECQTTRIATTAMTTTAPYAMAMVSAVGFT